MDVVIIIRNTLNTVCGQNTDIVNVTAGGIHTYRRALKGYVIQKVTNIAFSCLQRAR
jgi:hypothetical protein